MKEATVPQYFVMSGEGLTPAALIAEGPDLPSSPWTFGTPVDDAIHEPLLYRLDPAYPGLLQTLYHEEGVPLMRDDLVEALHEAGVDNLQLFPAVVLDETTGTRHTNYKAFNVVGIVSCADKNQSVLMGTTDSEMIDVDFDRLFIDESKTQGALLFRLAEAVNAIVVHESVRKTIEERGIDGIVFYGPGEWAG